MLKQLESDLWTPCGVGKMAKPASKSEALSMMFGWELLCELNRLRKEDKMDFAMAAVHWFLIRAGFRCLGLYDVRIYIYDFRL